MPQIVIPAIAGSLGVSTFVATALYYVGTTLITSWALSALSPKPNLSGTRGLLVNAKEPASAQDFIYGEVRKGGIITYFESTGAENKYLHQIIALAGHEVDSINNIYINDEVVTLDGNGFVTSTPWNSKIRIKKYTGSQTTAPAELLAESNQIDASFVGRGIAYLYVRYEYDQDVFANGLPLVTAVVRGKRVYDPRTATTAYSNNAALCIRDFLKATYGLNDAAIDDTVFSAAANISDENVYLDGGGTEKRYTINGVLQADLVYGDALQRMMTACAGTLFWGGGLWKLVVGDYVAPTKTLTLSDLRGSISLDTKVNLRNQFNVVQGTFNNASQRWIVADYPPIVGDGFIAEDGGERTPLDLELPLTTSSATAQRLAKLTLYRGREQMTFTADFGLNAFDVEVGEIIALTIDRYGWVQKEFEVIGWNFNSNQDAGDLRVSLTLRETSAAAFSWDAEESAIISNNTNLPNYQTVGQLSNLVLAATTVLNNDGIAIPAIKATWQASNNNFVQYYEIQYRRLGGQEDYGAISETFDSQEDWGSITVAATSTEDWGLVNEPIFQPDAEYQSTLSSTNSYTIQPVLNGYDYEIRVRAVSYLGVRGPWLGSSIASEGDVTPPGTPLSLSAVGANKFITVSWINPADQDLAYVEVWENSTNTLSTATLVGTSSSTNFIRPNLANNTTRFYWVRAVDFSLNKSPYTSSVSATTLLISPNDFDQAVNDLFTEAGAFGIEPVQSLPATGGFDGQLVLLLPDITIYRWDEATSSWSTEVYTGSALEAGSVGYTAFASGIEPVGVVNTLPTVSGYVGPSVVILTTDGKIYRLVSGAWTTAIDTDDLEGQLGENLFSDDLRPIERVSSLPSTGLFQGRVVLLTTDNKLYRYTGNAWTSAVPTTDLTGQITGTQITDNAITSSKISANSVIAGKIAANAVTATEISAGAVTADKITAGAISADKIAANAVTATKIAAEAVVAGKIAANAVDANALQANAITAGKIAAGAVSATQIASEAITTDKLFAGAVTADKIATDAVTANKIAASSIITSKIAAGAVTAEKISVNELSAISANLGTILVDSANIANLSVTNAKIDDLTIGTEKIQNLAVSNSGSVEVASYNVGSTSYTVAASFSFATAGSKPVLIQVAYDLEITASGGGENSRSVTFAFRREGSIIKEWTHGGVGRFTGLSRMDMTTSIDASTPVELLVKHSSGAGGTETVSNITLVAVEYKK